MSGSVSSGAGACRRLSRSERRAAKRRGAKTRAGRSNTVCSVPAKRRKSKSHAHPKLAKAHAKAKSQRPSTKRPDGGAALARPVQPVKQTPPPTDALTPVTGAAVDPWGNSAMANPFTSAQLARYAALVGGLSEPPKYLVKIYRAAARHYRIPWQVLAAINYVETGYGRDLRLSSAGAEGWMQFMPATWAQYGVNVGPTGKPIAGVADPWQPRDAIFAAARYLVAGGARRNLPRAIYAYNHAGWYVQEVLTLAAEINVHGLRPGSKAHRKIAAMRTMARLLNGTPYVWGGGHSNWLISNGYDCSGFVSSVLHAAGYLQIPQTTQTLPSVASIRSGPGRWVTIFDRTYAGISSDHVIIDIEGQWWESGGGGPSGAARVHRIRHMTGGYLRSFNLVLHPKGL